MTMRAGMCSSVWFTYSFKAAVFHFCAGEGFIPFMLISMTVGMRVLELVWVMPFGGSTVAGMVCSRLVGFGSD